MTTLCYEGGEWRGRAVGVQYSCHQTPRSCHHPHPQYSLLTPRSGQLNFFIATVHYLFTTNSSTLNNTYWCLYVCICMYECFWPRLILFSWWCHQWFERQDNCCCLVSMKWLCALHTLSQPFYQVHHKSNTHTNLLDYVRNPIDNLYAQMYTHTHTT